MGLIVRGLIKRGGVWWVRVVVPADLRSEIGKTELLESLGTGDDVEAVRLGTPILAKFKQQIANARGQVYTPPPPGERLTAALVQSRFDAWERRAIRDAEAAYINGELAPLSSWEAKLERSKFLYALAQPDAAGTVQGFKDRMAEALGVPINHPALDQRQFQFWFREAWRAVERANDRFAAGDFSEPDDEAGEDDEGSQSGPAAALSGFTNTLIAAAIGPLLVAYATEHVFGKPVLVGYSLALVLTPALVLGALFFILARAVLKRHADRDCGRAR